MSLAVAAGTGLFLRFGVDFVRKSIVPRMHACVHTIYRVRRGMEDADDADVALFPVVVG